MTKSRFLKNTCSKQVTGCKIIAPYSKKDWKRLLIWQNASEQRIQISSRCLQAHHMTKAHVCAAPGL